MSHGRRRNGRTSDLIRGDTRRFDKSLGPNRAAWVDTQVLQAILYVANDEEAHDRQMPGSEVSLYLRRMSSGGQGATTLRMNLTEYSKEELDELKKLIDQAFEMARPISESRDRRARERLEEFDDDTDPRLYRGVPRRFDRERVLDKYTTGIPPAPESVDEGDVPEE